MSSCIRSTFFPSCRAQVETYLSQWIWCIVMRRKTIVLWSSLDIPTHARWPNSMFVGWPRLCWCRILKDVSVRCKQMMLNIVDLKCVKLSIIAIETMCYDSSNKVEKHENSMTTTNPCTDPCTRCTWICTWNFGLGEMLINFRSEIYEFCCRVTAHGARLFHVRCQLRDTPLPISNRKSP